MMTNRTLLFNAALIASALALSASSVPARAGYNYCAEPSAPRLYARQPSKPFCASSRSCTQMDVDSYRRDVDRYISDLKAYLSDVDRFSNRAYEYARCMADLS